MKVKRVRINRGYDEPRSEKTEDDLKGKYCIKVKGVKINGM